MKTFTVSFKLTVPDHITTPEIVGSVKDIIEVWKQDHAPEFDVHLDVITGPPDPNNQERSSITNLKICRGLFDILVNL